MTESTLRGLHISHKTVSQHVSSIINKLGASNRTHAIAKIFNPASLRMCTIKQLAKLRKMLRPWSKNLIPHKVVIMFFIQKKIWISILCAMLISTANAQDKFYSLKKMLPLIDELSDSFRDLKTPSPKSVEEGLLWTTENEDSGYPLVKIVWFRSAGKKILLVINRSESALDWRFFTASGKFVGAITTSAREDDLKSSICVGDLKKEGVMEIYGLGLQSGGKFQTRPLDQLLDGVGGIMQPRWLVEDESIKFSILGKSSRSTTKSVVRGDVADVIEVKSDGLSLVKSRTMRVLAKKSLNSDCYASQLKPLLVH